MAVQETSSVKCFGGFQKVFKHHSAELKCDMNFAVYVPPQAASEKVPVLYWLSGLTCTEQNFITKAGAQRTAADQGIMIVAPDTSPRSCGIDGEDDSYDFGTGAGFYIDATEEKWKTNYRMFSYVTKELPALIQSNFPVLADKQSVFGHSMGGHGALTCFFKNPGFYKSVSAFAPICNPVKCPWGEKAFSGYLGSNKESWKEYAFDPKHVKSLFRMGQAHLALGNFDAVHLTAKELEEQEQEEAAKLIKMAEHGAAVAKRKQKALFTKMMSS